MMILVNGDDDISHFLFFLYARCCEAAPTDAFIREVTCATAGMPSVWRQACLRTRNDVYFFTYLWYFFASRKLTLHMRFRLFFRTNVTEPR